MSNDILKYLSDKIQEEMKVIEQDMVRGAAKDFSEYRHSAGVHRGLFIANNLIIETAERMEKDDD
jgi:hypothetical protein